MADVLRPLFISHSSTDRDRVRALAAALERAGRQVWIDVTDITGGASYGEAIVDAIRNADALLLMCSATSLASRNVRQEIALAWRFGRPIIPLRLEPVLVPDALAYWLETAQWIDVLDRPDRDWLPEVERALDRLASRATGDYVPQQDRGDVLLLAALPIPPTVIVGRERELAEIDERLRAGARLLTLTGPGGTGKTHLALEAARAAASAYPDGTIFVDLAPLSDPAHVLPAIAVALGVRSSGEKSLATELGDFLHPRRLLLVLDNMEQVVGAAGGIAGLLTTAPGLAVLVTSRAPLAIRAEQELPIDPLPVPSPGADIPTIMASPAVTLFLERVRATGRQLEPTQTTIATVGEIVRRLDGLPLAIELAAARVKLFPPEALLRRLEHRLATLVGGPRDLPGRQQTLTATIGWSHDLLAPEEQTLFQRLAVFAGGCTFEMAETVAASEPRVDPYTGLAALVQQSLLRQEHTDGEPRFVILETIREYAAEQLSTSGEEPVIRRVHAETMCTVVQREETRLRGPHAAQALERLEEEHANARSALAWTIAERNGDVAVQLVAELARFWFTRGYLSEGRDWLEQALALPHQGAASTARIRALGRGSTIAQAQGDFNRATTLAEEALRLSRESADRTLLIGALTTRSAVALALGELELAAALLEEALPLARELLPPQSLASVLTQLADLGDERGDLPGAIALLDEAISLKRGAGDRHGLAFCLYNLGHMRANQGKTALAVSLFDEALGLFREFGDRRHEGTALHSLGNAAMVMKEPGRAVSLFSEAHALFVEVGDADGIADSLSAFGQLAAGEGRAELALRLFAASSVLREEIGSVEHRPERSNQAIAHARAALGKETAEAAWASGRALTPQAAIDEALAWAKAMNSAP